MHRKHQQLLHYGAQGKMYFNDRILKKITSLKTLSIHLSKGHFFISLVVRKS